MTFCPVSERENESCLPCEVSVISYCFPKQTYKRVKEIKRERGNYLPKLPPTRGTDWQHIRSIANGAVVARHQAAALEVESSDGMIIVARLMIVV